MKKVVVIGIDGMDSLLLSKFEKKMPNITKLKKRALDIKMKSVFPPDSPTAWTSIYTGLNPAKHGVITFRDPLTPSIAGEYLGHTISGKTFWDRV